MPTRIDETDGVPAPSKFEPLGTYCQVADVTAPDDTALGLLSKLYYLISLHAGPSTFSNGVTYQGMDEGEVLADRFLARVQQFLAAHGDTYARGDFPSDTDTPF